MFCCKNGDASFGWLLLRIAAANYTCVIMQVHKRCVARLSIRQYSPLRRIHSKREKRDIENKREFKKKFSFMLRAKTKSKLKSEKLKRKSLSKEATRILRQMKQARLFHIIFHQL